MCLFQETCYFLSVPLLETCLFWNCVISGNVPLLVTCIFQKTWHFWKCANCVCVKKAPAINDYADTMSLHTVNTYTDTVVCFVCSKYCFFMLSLCPRSSWLREHTVSMSSLTAHTVRVLRVHVVLDFVDTVSAPFTYEHIFKKHDFWLVFLFLFYGLKYTYSGLKRFCKWIFLWQRTLRWASHAD